MLSNNNIPSQPATLTPAQIQQYTIIYSRLSPEEMRSMLIAMHQSAQPPTGYQEEHALKTKQIFKFKNKK